MYKRQILDIHDKKFYFGFDRSQKYNLDDNANNIKGTGTTSTHLEHHEPELGHVESKDRRNMQTLIEQFSNVRTPKFGLRDLIECKINLSDNKVIRLAPYLSLIHI